MRDEAGFELNISFNFAIKLNNGNMSVTKARKISWDEEGWTAVFVGASGNLGESQVQLSPIEYYDLL